MPRVSRAVQYSLSEGGARGPYVLELKSCALLLECPLLLEHLVSFAPRSALLLAAPPHVDAHDAEPPIKRPRRDAPPAPPPDTSSAAFVQIGGGAPFINSPEVKFRAPHFGLYDVARLDAVLVSSYRTLLALPFLTERTGFRGRVFATEPTVFIARQLLTALIALRARVAHFPVPLEGYPHWQRADLYLNSPKEFQAYFPELLAWQTLFSTEELQRSLERIEIVSYGETRAVSDAVEICSAAAGETLGAANWIIRTPFKKIVYAGATSFAARSCAPLQLAPLESADVLIATHLADKDAVKKKPEHAVADVCAHVVATLHAQGSVLLPTHAATAVYDLLEPLLAALGTGALATTPIYIIDPVAASLMAYANIIAEWLVKERQERAYVPEAPFAFARHVASGRVRCFANAYDGAFGHAVQEPCIVFCSHPSLRLGDAADLLNAWKSNPKNALILVEPEYDLVRTLQPFEPLRLKIVHAPLDTRLRVGSLASGPADLERFVAAVKPTRVLLPEHFVKRGVQLGVREVVGFAPLSVTRLSLRADFHRALLSPQLAETVQTTKVGNRVITRVRGLLSLRDGTLTLNQAFRVPTPALSSGAPQPPLKTEKTEQREVVTTSADPLIPAQDESSAPRERLFGVGDWSQLLSTLLDEFESDEFDVFEEEGAVTLRLAHLGAELVVTPTQTTIRTRDLKLRRRLAHLVARHFYSS